MPTFKVVLLLQQESLRGRLYFFINLKPLDPHRQLIGSLRNKGWKIYDLLYGTFILEQSIIYYAAST